MLSAFNAAADMEVGAASSAPTVCFLALVLLACVSNTRANLLAFSAPLLMTDICSM